MEKTQSQTAAKGSGSVFASFLNRIGGVFLTPDTTFNQIISSRIGFWEPLILILLLIGIEGAVLASFAIRVLSAIMGSLGPVASSTSLGFLTVLPAMMIIMMIASFLILWIIVAGIAHLIARFVFGGRGSFVQLLKLYGYSFAPYSLAILGTVFVGISWITWPLAVFLNIAATFWVVVLMTSAVKHNYDIDTGKAFISSFVGPMLVWLIIVGIFWLWILLLMNSFAGGVI
jgi:hypothetical protein